MPKDTFFNLNEEKRRLILDAAFTEFENNNYDQASINQIVKATGISKGSFYQYFDDKKDLYKYILNLMIQKKLEYITPVMQNPFEHGFFDVIREMSLSALLFAGENPQMMQISKRLIKDPSNGFYQELVHENQGQAHDIYKMLLTNAIKRGEVRSNIDVDFAAKFIFNTSAQLVETEIDFNDADWEEKIMDLLNKFMNLFEHGLSNKAFSDENHSQK
ncbi:MAG: hypothetical protein BGO41_05290 [Clostridiales bacterium 38-18]|nr:MAG: hypothetical protein BGO41_05290 [Clostridiales bacterium 38-18]